MRRVAAAFLIAAMVGACATPAPAPSTSTGAQPAAATPSPFSQFLAKLKTLVSPVACLEGVTFSIVQGGLVIGEIFVPGLSIAAPIASGLASIGTPYCKNLGTDAAAAASGH